MSIYDFVEADRAQRGRRSVLVEEDFSWSDAPRSRVDETLGEPVIRRTNTPAPRIIRSSSSRLDGVLADQRRPVDSSRASVDAPTVEPAPQDELDPLAEAERDWHAASERESASRSRAVVRARPAQSPVRARRPAQRAAARRRPRPAAIHRYDRPAFRGERLAFWAFLLTLILFLGAVGTSHAAVLTQLPH